MDILLIEPFYTGSHAAWAEGLRQHSRHRIDIVKLPGRYWKWRMHGGAITMARAVKKRAIKPDLLLCSDMLNLPVFLSLVHRHLGDVPVAMYFHENQLSYPWSPQDPDVHSNRDRLYGFINYASALASDHVFFNSNFHRTDFLHHLKAYMAAFPDKRHPETLDEIEAKSSTLPLGLSLRAFDIAEQHIQNDPPVILWNHRWEYDKNPQSFFHVLFRLQDAQVPFQLVLLGERFEKSPAIFQEALEKLSDHLCFVGFADTFEAYASWLWRSDILPVTSRQDFFGGSVVEAIYCRCDPLLPNRLALPDHVPEDVRARHVYENDDELFIKLRRRLLERPMVDRALRKHVEQYDWLQIIGHYDEALEAVKARY